MYSRRIIGWQTSTRLYTDLALDALQMAVWQRKRQGVDLFGLVHHSDRGVQYRSIRYGQALSDCEAVASVGSKGDFYDNALAEALSTRCTRPSSSATKDPGRTSTPSRSPPPSGSTGTGTTRPHSAIGMRTPAEHEAAWKPDTHRHEQSQPATTGTR